MRMRFMVSLSLLLSSITVYSMDKVDKVAERADKTDDFYSNEINLKGTNLQPLYVVSNSHN